MTFCASAYLAFAISQRSLQVEHYFLSGKVNPTIIHPKRYSCLQALNGVLNYVVNIEWYV